jgi:uncharacterized protein YbaP (TraB family)
MKGRQVVPAALAALFMMGAVQASPPAAPPPPPANAAPPASAPDPNESAVVQELEVIGHYLGPPQWTVHRGDAQVVVLGAVSPLPHTLEWNTHRFDRALEGARLVILPPTGRVGMLDALYVLLHQGDLGLPHGQRLWDKLTPDERARFDRLRIEARTEAKRYEHMKPAVAGMILDADFEKAAGLSAAKPGSSVKRMAEQRQIRTQVEGLPVVSLFRAVVRMDDAASRACFDAFLADTELHERRGHAIAEAWANGDLAALKGEYVPSAAEQCVAGAPGLQSFVEKLTRDAQAQIDTALAKGGKTVAVIDLRVLLRANGVLDRLKAEGAVIDVPWE